MKSGSNTVIFDLDGTLLDTLSDLTASTNHALRCCGYPEKSEQEVRSSLGNGFARLIELSLPSGAHNPQYLLALTEFKRHYSLHYNQYTKPYPGILALLATLQEKQIKLAIVSNKYQEAVSKLNTVYFQNYISVAFGEQENIPRKPAPNGLFQALHALNSRPDQAIYVGDSGVDLKTAQNAHMECILVSWGFSSPDQLKNSLAKNIVHRPEEILPYLGL